MTVGRYPAALKVCGLVREEDVRLCLDLGVNFTGFIFAESPRRVEPESVRRMPAGQAARVGVFAGQSVDEVLGVMETAGLDFAQLHGGESVEFCRAVGPERVIKTLWPQKLVRESGEEKLTEQLNAVCKKFADVCAMFLLDAGLVGGGSGCTLHWSDLRDFSPPRPWLLAGGLGPENAVLALEACTPFGLDCNSGVESSPGVKDAEKLRTLVTGLNA